MERFRMGTLDHVHLVVDDRDAAARWYQQVLGFERVPAFEVWARIEGGPLHLSADGGRSGVALFEPWDESQRLTNGKGVAFRVGAEQFVAFALLLPRADVRAASGEPLRRASVVDFDLCYSYGFVDPYRNELELNCYDCAEVRERLIEREGITPVRKW